MNAETTQAVKDLGHCNTYPFYMDQCNSKGVCVKDSRGLTVFFESFADFPDEFNASQREDVINTAIAVANLLVAISNTEYAKHL